MTKKHVRSAVFVDNDGDEVALDDVERHYLMEELQLSFECPICESYNEQTFSYPLNDSEQYTCTTCANQYFMVPYLEQRGDSGSVVDRIEYQLDCVEGFHAVVNRQPQEAAALASAPEMGTYGTAAVIAASAGITLLAVTSGAAFANQLYTIGFVLAALGLGLGTIGLLFGSIGTLYKGYLIYTAGEYDFSYYEFLRRAGNYYHRNPFVWSV